MYICIIIFGNTLPIHYDTQLPQLPSITHNYPAHPTITHNYPALSTIMHPIIEAHVHVVYKLLTVIVK